MNAKAIELQKAIVVALAQSVPEAWERIVVNYEMKEEFGGLTQDRLGFHISRSDAGWRKSGLVFTEAVKRQFRELADLMAGEDGSRWGTCDLVIDQPGTFKFQFSYDPPKRINGVFDEQSLDRFSNYIESYATERGGR